MFLHAVLCHLCCVMCKATVSAQRALLSFYIHICLPCCFLFTSGINNRVKAKTFTFCALNNLYDVQLPNSQRIQTAADYSRKAKLNRKFMCETESIRNRPVAIMVLAAMQVGGKRGGRTFR